MFFSVCNLTDLLLYHYVSPHEMGRYIDFSSIVCLSVRPSVCHAFVSALYLSNPWWDLQITYK